MARPANPRAIAARVIKDVLVAGQSLDTSLERHSKGLQTQDSSLCMAICFGVCRHYFSLSDSLMPLLDKPLRNKDKDIFALLLIGAYQLGYLRTPDYAAVDTCVQACRELKKPWASKLVNAVLRQYQQGMATSPASTSPFKDHPAWLYKQLASAWPDQLESVLEANNTAPPLCLRVNLAKTSREAYSSQLLDDGYRATPGHLSPAALYLHDKPADITSLPGFGEGLFSVQDEAPQLSAYLLDLMPGQHVLDACAAPGGKTCHMLEHQGELDMLAMDIDARRLERVHANLERLGLAARCEQADITAPSQWWDGKAFDRILCDVPCSATGVIRRHPDIKLLREAGDIGPLAAQQLAILKALWPCLAPGGILLYATCSILPAENERVIEAFCAMENTCEPRTINEDYGMVTGYGRQLLPTIDGPDGFYYARLAKTT